MAYIDRNELINNLNKFAPEHYNALINQLIVNQPVADVVEVVRCKDCGMSRETEDERFLFCMQFADTVGCQSFCSYGERKPKKDG